MEILEDGLSRLSSEALARRTRSPYWPRKSHAVHDHATDGGWRMSDPGNLSNLSVRLHQIEQQYAADRSGICDSRLSVISAAEGYRRTRYRLGEALAKYKSFFIEQGGWLVAAKLIADALGCDERTVRRIVNDYERVSAVPATVIKALEQAGIDPAARRNSTMIARILRMSQKDLLNDVEGSLQPAIAKGVKCQTGSGVNQYDRRCLTLRKRIRAALQKTPLDQKLSLLVAAIEEEMYLEWGQREAITLTITPHPHSTDKNVSDRRMVA